MEMISLPMLQGTISNSDNLAHASNQQCRNRTSGGVKDMQRSQQIDETCISTRVQVDVPLP